MGLDMADGHEYSGDSLFGSDLQTSAMQVCDGLAAGFVADFDVRPGNAVPPARADEFQHSFLHREPTRQRLNLALLTAFAVFLFPRREDPVQKLLTKPFNAGCQPDAIHHIHTMCDDIIHTQMIPPDPARCYESFWIAELAG